MNWMEWRTRAESRWNTAVSHFQRHEKLISDLQFRVTQLEDAATKPTPEPEQRASCPEQYRSFGRQSPCCREYGHPGAHRHGEVQWY